MFAVYKPSSEFRKLFLLLQRSMQGKQAVIELSLLTPMLHQITRCMECLADNYRDVYFRKLLNKLGSSSTEEECQLFAIELYGMQEDSFKDTNPRGQEAHSSSSLLAIGFYANSQKKTEEQASQEVKVDKNEKVKVKVKQSIRTLKQLLAEDQNYYLTQLQTMSLGSESELEQLLQAAPSMIMNVLKKHIREVSRELSFTIIARGIKGKMEQEAGGQSEPAGTAMGKPTVIK